MAEATQKTESIKHQFNDIKYKDYLNINEASLLFGISRRTIYRLIADKRIRVAKFGRRTVILKDDFTRMFGLTKLDPAVKTPKQEQSNEITEFYTIKEIEQLFHIKYARLNVIIKKHNIPKTIHNSILLISKPHIDRYFKRTRPDVSNITEWYTVDEIQDKYGLSRDQVYRRVSENGIPKQREGKRVKISKPHFDRIMKPIITTA